MKLALVHDWILGVGGAERVLKVFHEMWPEAPIYTFFHNPQFTKSFLPGAEIRPSALQRYFNFLPHKFFTPFLPLAAESWDMSEFDLVISSSIAFSKGLILKPKTKHLCYCYSPTRFLWDWHLEYKNYESRIMSQGWIISLLQHFLRIWDRQASTRVDQFVAISKNVQARIKKYYRREATVIYPPLTLSDSLPKDHFCHLPLTNYFLIVSRLFPHKNIGIAIEAFNKLEWPLLIVGDGPEYHHLKSKIKHPDLIKIERGVSDSQLALYYFHAKAFILPQEEDFGLTPLEAMSFGKPVLALRRGGALEYIQEGVNGEWFDDPHPAVLANGVRRLTENFPHYDQLAIKKTAERFSRQRFEEAIRTTVNH